MPFKNYSTQESSNKCSVTTIYSGVSPCYSPQVTLSAQIVGETFCCCGVKVNNSYLDYIHKRNLVRRKFLHRREISGDSIVVRSKLPRQQNHRGWQLPSSTFEVAIDANHDPTPPCGIRLGHAGGSAEMMRHVHFWRTVYRKSVLVVLKP